MPIKFILKSRRILFLQTILQRPEEELTRRVGDFCQLVEDDLSDIGEEMSEIRIKLTNRIIQKRNKGKNQGCSF